MKNIGLAIHGGAGTILRSMMTPGKQGAYENGLQSALDAGYKILESGGTSLDAVETAVKFLEDCPLFNAGRGSVFNHEGQHEMDAAIMNGADLAAGAVCSVKGIQNPVSLARAVMEKSEHVFLGSTGAEAFAKHLGFEILPDTYFHDDLRYEQWQEALKDDTIRLDHTERKFGTVGAVALDRHGNLAAATSTGGMTNKKFGRIGDSPVIGAGTYANDATCAVSCTGHGELFLRAVVAYDVSSLMAYKNLSLEKATHEVVMKKLVKIGGEGGLVAIDKAGNIALPFNSEGMYRAWKNKSGQAVLIYKDTDTKI